MSIHSSTDTKSGVRFWQAHLRALGGSGLSRREYCRRHHLSYHALTYWVRKLRPRQAQERPRLRWWRCQPARYPCCRGRALHSVSILIKAACSRSSPILTRPAWAGCSESWSSDDPG